MLGSAPDSEKDSGEMAPEDAEWLAQKRQAAGIRAGESRANFQRFAKRQIVAALGADIRQVKSQIKTAREEDVSDLQRQLTELEAKREAHEAGPLTKLPFEGADERMARDIQAGMPTRQAYIQMRRRKRA